MQRNSIKIQTLAEIVRSGKKEYTDSKELLKEARKFFRMALESEEGEELENGIAYCRAAKEDLELAQEISDQPEKIYTRKIELSLYQQRLKIALLMSEQKYQKILEEVDESKGLSDALKDNNKFSSGAKLYMIEISRMGRIAKKKLDDIDCLDLEIKLENLQDQMAAAVKIEDYENAALYRDKIKELENGQ